MHHVLDEATTGPAGATSTSSTNRFGWCVTRARRGRLPVALRARGLGIGQHTQRDHLSVTVSVVTGRSGDTEQAEAGVRRTATLAADLRSAAQARQLLREVLLGTAGERWLDVAELACSELVSNVVLHAHTALELTVDVEQDRLRVQVRDFSPVLPLQRSYDARATTGRGLSLVAALTSEHGIGDAGPDGKTVWFTLTGDPAEQNEQELLDAWNDADWELDDEPKIQLGEPAPNSPVPAPPAEPNVVLLAFPAALWLAAVEHNDALTRELALYLAEHDDVQVDLAATDLCRGTLTAAVWAGVEQSQQPVTIGSAPPGHANPLAWLPGPLDLPLHIPPVLSPAFRVLQDTLDAAERLAGQGRLLVRPGLPEILAVRDWACEQVVAQLVGAPPSPWPGIAQDGFTTEGHAAAEGPLGDWDAGVIRDADRGVVAADDANRILAVSTVLAQLLGWQAQDLIGRRVITLVPPRLREGHVAGFSRHLSTGEAHLLGVPVTLPALHADGTELLCHVLIEQAPPYRGRSVYLAWIEPVTR